MRLFLLELGRRIQWLALIPVALCAFVASSTIHAQPATAALTAIEYYHAELDHYFVTASPLEIQALNSGQFAGWVPTGLSFPVLPDSAQQPGAVSTCRFYGNPVLGLDSHFYSASEAECEDVVRRFPEAWTLESRNVFRVMVPDASGSCPAGTRAIRRLYNQRSDANHRYTDDDGVAGEMQLKGYVVEGYGQTGLPTAFCVPIAPAEITCEVTPSKATPAIGETVTLSADCSGSPARYQWIGCDGLGGQCTATASTAGARAYVVFASAGDDRPPKHAVGSVVWQAANGEPTTGMGPPRCSIVASQSNPTVGSDVTLTASCSGTPTRYIWNGCASSTNRCVVRGNAAGAVTYSVSVSAANGMYNASASIIVNWQALGTAITCSIAASNAQPTVDTQVVIQARCTGNPTSYAWTGCGSANGMGSGPSGPSCTVTSSAAGARVYTLVARNASAASTPASVSVNWLPAGSTRPVCTVSAAASTPAINTNVTLTASCTGNPTSFTWTGCTSTAASCTTSSAAAGTRAYSVVARNGAGASAPAGVSLNWQSGAPPSPPTPGLAYTTLPGDPASYSAGWTRMLYSPNLGKLVIFGGDSHNASGNNSVRYFDARSKAWEIALPNSNGASGLRNRDNHAMFVNSSRGELIALEGAVKGNGVFDLNARRWTVLDAASGRTDTASKYIRDFDKYVYAEDPAHTYSATEDTFVTFGGNRHPSIHLFVPNAGGPQPYRLLQHIIRWGSFFPMGDNLKNPNNPGSTAEDLWSPSAPNGVDQLENSGVAVGSSMYWMQNLQIGVSLCGTKLETLDAQGQWAGSYRHNSDELWRLDIPATARNISRPAFEFLGRNPLPEGTKIVGGKWVSAHDPKRGLYIMVKGRQVNVYSIARKLWWGGIVSDAGVGDNAVGDIDPVADVLVIRWHDGAPGNNHMKALDLRKLDPLIATSGTPPIMQRQLIPFEADPRIRRQATCTPDKYFYRDVTPPPTPGVPSCNVVSSSASPNVNSSVTLTASCTNSPTAYTWSGCSGNSSSCTATSSSAGPVAYSVTARNAAGASSPVQITVNWQAASTVPSCTLTANNTAPVVNSSLVLTASCTGNPTSYAWTGCSGSSSTCTTTSASTGTANYSVVARNAVGNSPAAQVAVAWQPAPTSPPPTGTGSLKVVTTAVDYTGPARVLGSSKHLDFARLGDRWYKMTGDHARLDANSPTTQGGRQEILSFNVARNDWRQDQPYYIPDASQMQIAMPDDAFTIVRNDEAWVFISERVVTSAAIPQVPGMAEQVTEQIMAWKPGRGWRKILQRPGEIRGNRAWRGAYDPVQDRFVIPVARNGLVWILIGGDGTDRTKRTATGTAFVYGNQDFHASGLALDPSSRLAYAYDHVKSELWSVNLDTFAMQKVATLPEASQGNSPTTKVAWHPGLRAVVIAATKLHAFEVDSGKLTTWNRPDGFVNGAGRRVTSSTIFYDPDTQDIVSVGSIDWDTGKTSPVYWRMRITR